MGVATTSRVRHPLSFLCSVFLVSFFDFCFLVFLYFSALFRICAHQVRPSTYQLSSRFFTYNYTHTHCTITTITTSAPTAPSTHTDTCTTQHITYRTHSFTNLPPPTHDLLNSTPLTIHPSAPHLPTHLLPTLTQTTTFSTLSLQLSLRLSLQRSLECSLRCKENEIFDAPHTLAS